MKIEYYYTKATGIVPGTQAVIQEAINEAGISEAIQYIEVFDDADAHAKRCLGSPTIRVNGLDVEFQEREPPEYQAGTRFYGAFDGWKPNPSSDQILRLIQEQMSGEPA